MELGGAGGGGGGGGVPGLPRLCGLTDAAAGERRDTGLTLARDCLSRKRNILQNISIKNSSMLKYSMEYLNISSFYKAV